mmetsp:Transcript_6312/g.23792  ORF Transcript_6312/g.23792 Transcript_6312/m.23792 type:complete len:91 (+) Transcript_6312:526-798(+)
MHAVRNLLQSLCEAASLPQLWRYLLCRMLRKKDFAAWNGRGESEGMQQVFCDVCVIEVRRGARSEKGCVILVSAVGCLMLCIVTPSEHYL